MDERTAYERDHAANIARLEQLAQDADEKAVEFRQADRKIDAAFYAGMCSGLSRAINVLNGNG